ncbi:hypothetical protein H0H93_000829 [Arthromyces matolae]|nr:hypothetical protein H0H93_000829 [Arthromyces matolae]
MASAQALFTPLKVGSVTLRNRITMAALTRNRAPDTIPGDAMLEYYAQRAEGGAGLITTEGVLITPQGTEWPWAPGISTKEHVSGWKPIVDIVHAKGAAIYAQLWHVGRIAHPDAPEHKRSGTPVYAPSAISARGGKFRHMLGAPSYVTHTSMFEDLHTSQPTALEDPTIIIALFKQAAINAKEAGFDGVELHGANGYIVHQFLDNTANKRTDKWGGSVENRARFGLETLKVLIEVFGENVALKVSPAGGYNDMGMPLQDTLDTYRYFLSEVDKLGLSYIVVMRYALGTDPTFDGKFISELISHLVDPLNSGQLRATNHDTLAAYRPVIKNTNLFLNAGVLPDEGAKLVEEGKIDGVQIGVNWIAHPDLAKRVQDGKPLDNIPDVKHFYYNMDGSELSIGYTDYPTAT